MSEHERFAGTPEEQRVDPTAESREQRSRSSEVAPADSSPGARALAGVVDAGELADESGSHLGTGPASVVEAPVARPEEVDGTQPSSMELELRLESDDIQRAPVYVLGRQVDTAVAANWSDHRVLDIPDWTPAKNEDWIKEAVDQRAEVYVGSNQTFENMWDPVRESPRMFAQELDWLDGAGYTYDLRDDGVYLVPPDRQD